MRTYIVPPPNNPAWPEVEIFKAVLRYSSDNPDVYPLMGLGPESENDREAYDHRLHTQLYHRTLNRVPDRIEERGTAYTSFLHTETLTLAPLSLRYRYPGIKQIGLLHGGSFLDHDSIKLPPEVEELMITSMNKVIVPTYWVKQQYVRKYTTPCEVSGYPLNPLLFSVERRKPEDRSRTVIFPHRKIPEKGWDLFQNCQAAAMGGRVDWWALNLPRHQFYTVAAHAKVVFANTQFELCCVAVEEAMVLGCCPVLNRYPVFEEMYEGCDVHWHDGTVKGVLEAVEDAMSCTKVHYNHTIEDSRARARRIIEIVKEV